MTPQPSTWPDGRGGPKTILVCSECGMVTTVGAAFPSQCPKGAHRHQQVSVPVYPASVAKELLSTLYDAVEAGEYLAERVNGDSPRLQETKADLKDCRKALSNFKTTTGGRG